MKFLLVIVVVAVVLWLMFGRGKRIATKRRRGAGKPVEMVACAHCGVHLPRGDAVIGADDRSYCGEAHRVAGPR